MGLASPTSSTWDTMEFVAGEINPVTSGLSQTGFRFTRYMIHRNSASLIYWPMAHRVWFGWMKPLPIRRARFAISI